MSEKTAIIFSELTTKFPNIQEDLGRFGLACHLADGGRRALEQAQELNPSLLLLDVAMPEMSGIECCRQIKEGALREPPKIILISSLESSGIEQRAQDAGCDRYLLETEAQSSLNDILASFFAGDEHVAQSQVSEGEVTSAPDTPVDLSSSDSGSDRRSAPRIEIPSPVLYTVEKDVFHGRLMNLSQSGVLFAASQDIPIHSLVELRFRTVHGQEFNLATKVVRTIPLKKPQNGLSFGIGATFEKTGLEDDQKIDWLLDAKLELKLPGFSPDQLRQFLDGDETLVGPVMRNEHENAVFDIVLGQKTNFEISAFGKEENQADCVKRLVFLRAQLRAFRAFVPTLAKNKGTFAGIFLPFIPPLFEKVASIEEESNGFVREAVESGDETSREGLIQTSNALFDARVALVCALADHLSPDGLGDQGEFVRRMHVEAEQIRSRQVDEFDQKYARRAPVPEPKEEEKESDFMKSLSSKKTWILASVFAFFTLLGVGGYFLSQRVAPNELGLPVGVSSITKVHNGVDVIIEKGVWSNWPDEDKEICLQKLEEYMSTNRQKQVKIKDENGRRIAVIMGTKYGQDWVFNRRFY